MKGSFWAADPAFGGAILGEAVHFIDLMYWLLDSEPVEVFAFSLPEGKKEPIGENNLAACFQFKDGSIANLTYCTIGSKASQGEAVEVYYAGGAIVAAGFKNVTQKGLTNRRMSSFWPRKGYNEQMKSFVNAIKIGQEPEVTVVDGIRSTIGALRMLESARSKYPCAIDIESFLR
jgi:predicted dehydrogenase